mmetsp:Transcript_18200/g.35757  ORF Transcript_18200/g.35757 Transcript_18200/m.35757 type:complete len:136 (-) Transcript_18200:267-674(-)|eukprot:CAMPEP_0171501248 /NCGR_PEP_ID=MMETSP0958-20121227/9451_1 /TAXON_ID=87120 /ORGANISM="Aurantiochytrium limacinum, Strain ATCCMYA-1381" /LENGTH=135 /DNA_ID=CAMNT_0012036039 /DNA_START=177 /DNA_END=584 /DNA_ORIENTATION=-
MADEVKERVALEDHEFSLKLGQVKRQPSERDRARLIKNMVENFVLSVDQAIALVDECQDFQSKMDASLEVVKAIPEGTLEEFANIGVAKLFKYKEDRTEFCEKLGVDYREPDRPKSVSRAKVATFDKQSVAGYSV